MSTAENVNGETVRCCDCKAHPKTKRKAPCPFIIVTSENARVYVCRYLIRALAFFAFRDQYSSSNSQNSFLLYCRNAEKGGVKVYSPLSEIRKSLSGESDWNLGAQNFSTIPFSICWNRCDARGPCNYTVFNTIYTISNVVDGRWKFYGDIIYPFLNTFIYELSRYTAAYLTMLRH
jgi:hypothetical protein